MTHRSIKFKVKKLDIFSRTLKIFQERHTFRHKKKWIWLKTKIKKIKKYLILRMIPSLTKIYSCASMVKTKSSISFHRLKALQMILEMVIIKLKMRNCTKLTRTIRRSKMKRRTKIKKTNATHRQNSLLPVKFLQTIYEATMRMKPWFWPFTLYSRSMTTSRQALCRTHLTSTLIWSSTF